MSGPQKKTHYIQADMHRILCRKETCLAILGVAAALFFSVGNVQDFEGSVIQTFLFATYNVGFLLSFVFCALPYGTAYCEELENHFRRIRDDAGMHPVCLAAVLLQQPALA